MKKKFHPLKTGEVICVANPVQFVSPHNTFRVSELAEALKQELIKYSSYGVSEEDLGWLSLEGSDCAVLQFGAPGWKKGKLRIKIEFCPDDTEIDSSDYGDEEEEELVVAAKSTNTDADKVQPQAVVSTAYPNSHKNPFDDVASDLESDNFSLEPDLDFIAESATVLEFNRPAAIPGNKVNQDDDINEMLSETIEDELNAVSESENDPFPDAQDVEFPESLDDDDNFGFGELDLDEDSDRNNSSDFDSVWQDL